MTILKCKNNYYKHLNIGKWLRNIGSFVLLEFKSQDLAILLSNGPENVNKEVLFYNFELMSAKHGPSDGNVKVRKLYGIYVLQFGVLHP